MSEAVCTRLCIVGASGRMGQRLVALAEADGRLAVSAAVKSDGVLDGVDPNEIDIVIDFSVLSQVAPSADWCRRHGKGLVLGTTGLGPDEDAALDAAAVAVPVIAAPNFAIGVNALFEIVGALTQLLGEGFDLEVVEAHHRRKVDAPSGTARRLVTLLAEARKWSVASVRKSGRDGLVGARPEAEIGVHAVRGGGVVGDHSVIFLGEDEEITLSHRARSRDIFANGALRAARWAHHADPGRHTMADVLAG